jgi:hypothetical protein
MNIEYGICSPFFWGGGEGRGREMFRYAVYSSSLIFFNQTVHCPLPIGEKIQTLLGSVRIPPYTLAIECISFRDRQRNPDSYALFCMIQISLPTPLLVVWWLRVSFLFYFSEYVSSIFSHHLILALCSRGFEPRFELGTAVQLSDVLLT